MDRKSYKEFYEDIQGVSELVAPGDKFQHYKGGKYTVKELVIIEETEEIGVVYTPISEDEYSSKVNWLRPIGDFLAEIELDGESKTRFTKIS